MIRVIKGWSIDLCQVNTEPREGGAMTKPLMARRRDTVELIWKNAFSGY